MKRTLGSGLVLAVVLGFCVAQVLARGGHGGGHGGHHGGHHSGHRGHHGHANQHHASHHAHHHSHWANHNRPFSRGWYGNHRRAWGGGWGWGNPWGIANWATAGAWLGLGAAAPIWGGYGPTDTTIYDTDDAELSAADTKQPAGKPVTPETLAAESAAAKALAAKGISEPGQNEKFLPLGVFTLAPEDQTEASAMVQLAVSKQGVLRGSYFDLLSDVDHPIRGSVDKKTQRVAWNIGPQGKVTFQTALGVLTEPSGPVSVHYENGQTRQWVLARYEKEPTENDPLDESGEEPSAATEKPAR